MWGLHLSGQRTNIRGRVGVAMSDGTSVGSSSKGEVTGIVMKRRYQDNCPSNGRLLTNPLYLCGHMEVWLRYDPCLFVLILCDCLTSYCAFLSLCSCLFAFAFMRCLHDGRYQSVSMAQCKTTVTPVRCNGVAAVLHKAIDLQKMLLSSHEIMLFCYSAWAMQNHTLSKITFFKDSF